MHRLILTSLLLLCAVIPSYALQIDAGNPKLQYMGRTLAAADGSVQFAYSGAGVRIAFEGESISMQMEDLHRENWLNVYLDGKWLKQVSLNPQTQQYLLADGLAADQQHVVEVIKATEGHIGAVALRGFHIEGEGRLRALPERSNRRIEFIGDSITCGYGIEADGPEGQFRAAEENFGQTYAWNAAKALDAEYLVVARSGIGMFRNYNGPYEGSDGTMPDIYDQVFFRRAEPKWDFDGYRPDVICINLGTNDFSTKGVNEDGYEAAYTQFVQRLRELQPQARIVLLMGPMRNTENLKQRLLSVVSTVNAAEGEPVVSFFELSKQGKLGFGVHYHPSKAQAALNGRELAAYLSELMDWPLTLEE